MSESDVEPDESTPNRLLDALISFTGCVGGALDNICSYALVPGDSYIDFTPDDGEDCDEDEDNCSRVWVRVTDITPSIPEGWDQTCALTMNVGVEVGVYRCYTVPDKGEAPTASDWLAYSMQAMDDMRDLMCAAIGCEAVESVFLGVWTPLGPMGGEYGGQWTMSIEII